MSESERLLTAREVASMITMSVRFVQDQAKAGRLKRVEFGHSVRFRLSDVREYIEARVRGGRAA